MHHLSQQTVEPCHGLTRIDPRVKILTALALLVMVISSNAISFSLLVCALSVVLCLGLRISPKLLLLRFSEPLFIAGTILILKLFFSGAVPLFSIHLAGVELVAHRDGLMEGARIAARIVGSVSVIAVVGFSTPFTDLMAALSWLRVPQTLIEIALFAWRYLFLLLDDASIVYNAQKNRLGYIGCRRGLRSFGTLAGVLVIKAFDNSQSITTAMVQRGYDGQMPLLSHKPLKPLEIISAFMVVVGIGALRVI